MLLLQHLAQHLGQMPLLAVGTYRDTELDVARSLAKALEELLRRRLARDIILKRLPEADVSAMLQKHSKQKPPARLVELVYRETDGNPFFIEEIYRHFDGEGKLFDAEGRWRSDIEIGEAEVPRGVRLVIGRRLERVSEECRRALARAAVIGRGISFKLLNEVIELDVDTLLDAVEEAERAQLVRSTTRGGEAQLMFFHELIRQTLLNDLSTPRRQRLHLRTAEAMEQLFVDNLDPHAADLAYHFYQAGGDTEKTIEYAVIAGKRATAQTAFEEAVEQYQRALQALEQETPIDSFRQCDVLLLLARAYGNAGDPDHAKETFLKVADISRGLPAPEQFARAMVGIVEFWYVFGSVDSKLHNLMEESLALLPEEDSALRASLLGRMAYLVESAEGKRGTPLSEQAIAMARRVGDPEALWYALFARVFVWDRSLEDRIADAIELARLEEDGTCPVLGDQGLNYLSHLHRAKGDIAAFEADLAKFRERVAQVPHPASVWTLKFIEGAYTQSLGRFDESEQIMQEAFTIGEKMDEMVRTQGFGAFMYGLRYTQGRLSEMVHPSIAIEQYPYLRDNWMYRLMGAHFDCAVGNAEQAREEFERLAANDFRDFPRNWSLPINLAAMSPIAAAFGDKRRAALLYDLLLACPDRLIFIGINNACIGTKSHWLGVLATTMGGWDDAAEHFDDALELSARVGAIPWLARSQHEYARMLIERNESGDKEKAQTLLNEATATYRELGMPTFLENAEELLTNL
jgi:tetratricopeptide (TPR) repeat protein